MNLEKFLLTLFDSEESKIVSGSKYERVPRTVADVIERPGEFFTINELAIHAKGRETSDVSCFRNVLIELDNTGLEQQVQYIEDMKVPYTSAVYSGGKSIHFIISLEDAVSNEFEYYELSRFLLDMVLKGVDRSNKNPSRFSRTPNVTRPDTGRTQEILELKKRVSNQELLEFLRPYGRLWQIDKRKKAKAERVKAAKRKWMGDNQDFMQLISPNTMEFIKHGASEGDRHQSLQRAAVDLYHAGAELDQIQTILQPAADMIGIGDRGDLEQILQWIERRVVR